MNKTKHSFTKKKYKHLITELQYYVSATFSDEIIKWAVETLSTKNTLKSMIKS